VREEAAPGWSWVLHGSTPPLANSELRETNERTMIGFVASMAKGQGQVGHFIWMEI
jgi:hypothetical protein